jgi:hypothetical protein
MSEQHSFHMRKGLPVLQNCILHYLQSFVNPPPRKPCDFVERDKKGLSKLSGSVRRRIGWPTSHGRLSTSRDIEPFDPGSKTAFRHFDLGGELYSLLYRILFL